jgi:glycerol-3-phosphate acyltransferase PlsX
MSDRITIAIDAMGGDYGPTVTVPAALQALAEHPELAITVVGDEKALQRELQRNKAYPGDRLSLHHASEVVEMSDPPSKALRGKKDASMRVAADLVKDERARACISAGNTGAFMAIARFVLKTLPGIERPAIMSAIPSRQGHTHMLDLGANAECPSRQLFQFAVMGSVLSTAVDGLASPRVGLLNIGEEEIKGNDNIRETGELLNASSLNYIGFVEGNDIYTGEVDVVVCDGFVGNVALKSSEGLAKLIGQYMREEFERNLATKFAGLCALPVLRRLQTRMDPRHYNGASLVGLQGIAIKSHGGADVIALKNAIRMALVETEKSVPLRISRLLESTLAEAEVEGNEKESKNAE